jgi:RNA polymerase sigma-70 factor (sigma-E family)
VCRAFRTGKLTTRATIPWLARLYSMSSMASARFRPPGDLGDLPPVCADHPAGPALPEAGPERLAGSAESAVTALYQAHAMSLTRLAHVMLGDKASAEDVVQEAFWGLYRNWARLADPAAALPYLRASVLNGCRSAIRRRKLRASRLLYEPDAASAESLVLTGEEHRSVLAALRQLPARQREVLVMRFYACATDEEIARVMGISHGTVRSTSHRALAALGRLLGES